MACEKHFNRTDSIFISHIPDRISICVTKKSMMRLQLKFHSHHLHDATIFIKCFCLSLMGGCITLSLKLNGCNYYFYCYNISIAVAVDVDREHQMAEKAKLSVRQATLILMAISELWLKHGVVGDDACDL